MSFIKHTTADVESVLPSKFVAVTSTDGDTVVDDVVRLGKRHAGIVKYAAAGVESVLPPNAVPITPARTTTLSLTI
jgi:hypothetical protein